MAETIAEDKGINAAKKLADSGLKTSSRKDQSALVAARAKAVQDGVVKIDLDEALKIVSSRNAELRRRGTTPRNMFEGHPDWWDAPEEIKKRIQVLWISDMVLERQAALGGACWDMWKPIDSAMRAKCGLKFKSKQFDKNGVPKYGQDMTAHWCPMEMWNEQKDVFKSILAPAEERSGREKEALNRKLGGGVIGDITTEHSDDVAPNTPVLAEAEQKQREGMVTYVPPQNEEGE